MNHRIAVLLAGYAVMAVVTWCWLAYRDGRENLNSPWATLPETLFWPVTIIGFVIVEVLEVVCAVFVWLYNRFYDLGRSRHHGTK
ncbi:hypothetical protein CO704_09985 [Cedecea neteri]|uniref:Uncharacterized protein n=1 Tax=Cedecea neteri TaxID=158822 RepID=A0A291DXH8_9ENTR|nr:hypothetical protein CO704_09985 [Cedecea neteri]